MRLAVFFVIRHSVITFYELIFLLSLLVGLAQGCATFFVGGPHNQLQISSWARDSHTNMNRLTTPTQILICPAFLAELDHHDRLILGIMYVKCLSQELAMHCPGQEPSQESIILYFHGYWAFFVTLKHLKQQTDEFGLKGKGRTKFLKEERRKIQDAKLEKECFELEAEQKQLKSEADEKRLQREREAEELRLKTAEKRLERELEEKRLEREAKLQS